MTHEPPTKEELISELGLLRRLAGAVNAQKDWGLVEKLLMRLREQQMRPCRSAYFDIEYVINDE